MIETFKQELVDINLIKPDEKNPNKMTEIEERALKKNIQRYGFIIPIITNKEYLIADGQHRYKVAKELGMTQIPTIVLNVTEIDRKMIRQVMNKLRGSHDYHLDADEFKYLTENIPMEDISSLLAQSNEEIESYLITEDFEKLPNMEIAGETVNLKDVIIIQLENDEHAKKIRDFFIIPEGRKSVRSQQIVDALKDEKENT